MRDDPHPAPGKSARGETLSPEDRATLLRIARQTLEGYLESGEIPEWETDSPALRKERATFVTLRRRDTEDLRGCRGEIVATRPIVESVTEMAIASAVDDPRFPPVTLAELPLLHIEISALTPLEPIRPDDVVIGRHGLMITKGRYRGLLLPQVPEEWGWDREQFLEAVCRKAGLPEHAWRSADAQLFGFECEVWGEEAQDTGEQGDARVPR